MTCGNKTSFELGLCKLIIDGFLSERIIDRDNRDVLNTHSDICNKIVYGVFRVHSNEFETIIFPIFSLFGEVQINQSRTDLLGLGENRSRCIPIELFF